MTQVLLVINDKELSTILRGKLAQKYDVEVIVRNSAPEAISLFEILPDIEIILCSEFIDKVSAAGKICDYLNTKNEEDSREINIAVIGKSAPQNSKAVCIGENPSPQKIIDYLGFLLGKEEQNILEVEAKAEKEKSERERLEREKTQAEREKEEREREKIEKELAEKERIAREIAFKERMAREQQERELAEKEKAEKKKAIEERIERGKARLEQIEKEKAEKEKADLIKAEKMLLANELAKELAEKERVAREVADREKVEKETREREKLEKLKLEREFAEKERIAKERAEKERLANEKERLAKEREERLKEIANKEKNEKDRLEKERRQIENAEREKAAQERLERGNARKEKVEREKAEKEKEELEQKRIEQEKLEKEKLEKEKALQERLEKAKSRIGHVEKELEPSENEKTTVFRLPVLNPISEASQQNVVYSPINVIYFLNLFEELVGFSVYSRVKKGDGFDYIKKINANSKISIAELERILIRCGKELYVAQEDFSKANAFLNGLFLDRFKNPNLSFVDRMLLNSESFEILLDLFKNSSFNKFNVEIIKELIKSLDLQVKAPEALKTFLSGLKSKKISYGYSHAHLTYFLLLKIVDHFPWSKDQSKNKLLYLALFHDLSLNSDRLIKLHHNYSHEIKNLTEEEKEVLNVHADAAALVLESIVKAPVELTSLIREHHGFKSGKGHADSLSIAISPTSMAFIVIEDFVTQYLLVLDKMEGDKEGGPTKQQLELIFSELKKKYDRLTYSEVLVQIQKFIYSV